MTAVCLGTCKSNYGSSPRAPSSLTKPYRSSVENHACARPSGHLTIWPAHCSHLSCHTTHGFSPASPAFLILETFKPFTTLAVLLVWKAGPAPSDIQPKNYVKLCHCSKLTKRFFFFKNPHTLLTTRRHTHLLTAKLVKGRTELLFFTPGYPYQSCTHVKTTQRRYKLAKEWRALTLTPWHCSGGKMRHTCQTRKVQSQGARQQRRAPQQLDGGQGCATAPSTNLAVAAPSTPAGLALPSRTISKIHSLADWS